MFSSSNRFASGQSYSVCMDGASFFHVDGRTLMCDRDGTISNVRSEEPGDCVLGLAQYAGEPCIVKLGDGVRIQVSSLRTPDVELFSFPVSKFKKVTSILWKDDHLFIAGISDDGGWLWWDLLDVPRLLHDSSDIDDIDIDVQEHVIRLVYQRIIPTELVVRDGVSLVDQKINSVIELADYDYFDDRPCGEVVMVAEGIASNPRISILSDDECLVVFQVDGVKEKCDDYLRQREGDGSSIGFCLVSHGMKHDYVEKSQEFLVRNTGRSGKEYTTGSLLPRQQWFSCPVITKCGGMPYVFYIEDVTSNIYFRRWLGHQFSDAYLAGMEDMLYLPRESLDARFLLAVGGYCTVRRIPARPAFDMSGYCGFFDDSWVQEAKSLSFHLAECKKVETPVFTPSGASGDWDRDMVSMPYVLFVPERNLFCMFYTGGAYGLECQSGWHCGYAESHDGLDWKRSVITFDGQRCDKWIPFLHPFRDSNEPDSEKRYKSFFCWKEGGLVDGLAYSSDCKTWTVGQLFTDARRKDLGFTEIPVISFCRDGEYYITGRVFSDYGRAVGIMVSHNLVDWHGLTRYSLESDKMEAQDGPTLLMDASSSPLEESQIYYAYCQLVGLGDVMICYAPMLPDGRYDVRLAYLSEDFIIKRVGRLYERFVGCGKAGEWDNGFIAGFKPVMRDGVRHFYYGASGWHHNTDKNSLGKHRPNWKIGLARCPEGAESFAEALDSDAYMVSKPFPVEWKYVSVIPDCDDGCELQIISADGCRLASGVMIEDFKLTGSERLKIAFKRRGNRCHGVKLVAKC